MSFSTGRTQGDNASLSVLLVPSLLNTARAQVCPYPPSANNSPRSNPLLSPHAPKHFIPITRPIPKHLTEPLLDSTPQLRSISAPEHEYSLYHHHQQQSFRCPCYLFGRLNFDRQGNVIKTTCWFLWSSSAQYYGSHNLTWLELSPPVVFVAPSPPHS